MHRGLDGAGRQRDHAETRVLVGREVLPFGATAMLNPASPSGILVVTDSLTVSITLSVPVNWFTT